VIIPYTTERRADTGVTNVTLGMWLFIASEIMLFGALFSAYALLRSAATDWPLGRHILSLPMGVLNTALLLVVTSAVWRARNRERAQARVLLLLATTAACTFISAKSIDYGYDFNHGLLPHVNTFLAMYFTLTGLHFAHVVAGIGGNVWALRGRVSDAMTNGRVRALAIYWVFVDIVWLIIFVLFYLS
jgi:heme/copper-type cytochrome/quinol oxidase subunit 3